MFLANVSANSTAFYFLYFSSDTVISNKNYTTDLIYGNYLENSKIRLNITGEVTDLYNLQTSSSNLLAGRRLGITQYNSTMGGFRETNETSGTKTLLLDSSFKKVVQISGSTEWFDYKINVTLYAYQDYFILRSWTKEKLNILLQDFKNPESSLYSLFQTIAFRNNSGVFTSSSASGDVYNASWVVPYNSSSVSSVALIVRNYSAWQEAGWENSGKNSSFSHILNDYGAGTLNVITNQEFLGNDVFIYVFNSTSYTQVDNLWNKIYNPLDTKVLPQEDISALSVSKLNELRKMNYRTVADNLGGYNFYIEVGE